MSSVAKQGPNIERSERRHQVREREPWLDGELRKLEGAGFERTALLDDLKK